MTVGLRTETWIDRTGMQSHDRQVFGPFIRASMPPRRPLIVSRPISSAERALGRQAIHELTARSIGRMRDKGCFTSDGVYCHPPIKGTERSRRSGTLLLARPRFHV